jgi:hypothetical protein
MADTKLTVLHLHYLERPYLDLFKDFGAPVIQYSVRTSGITISEMRKHYAQPILGGVDEIGFRKLTAPEMRRQWTEAREQAGAKYIAAPGCSVPNDSTPEELARFPEALGMLRSPSIPKAERREGSAAKDYGSDIRCSPQSGCN